MLRRLLLSLLLLILPLALLACTGGGSGTLPGLADDDGVPDLVATVMEPFYSNDHTLHLALSGLSSNGDVTWTVTEIGTTSGANGTGSASMVQTSIGVPLFP